MKMNRLAIQPFQKLINTEYILKSGRLIPVPKKKEEQKKKKGIFNRVIEYFRQKKEEERIALEEIEKTKEIVDRLVNIKLDINKMILKDSRVRKYEDLKNSVLSLSVIDLNTISSREILNHFLSIDKFLKYAEKVGIKEEEVKSQIRTIRKNLIYALSKRVFVELDYLSSRIDYFILTQTKYGTIYDERTLTTSMNDLICYNDSFEEAYHLYLKFIKDKRLFDEELFQSKFKEVKGKIEEVLKINHVYTKCICPPKR